MSKAKHLRSRDGEIEDLRARLAEAQETLLVIRRGDLDAIAVEGPHGRQIFTREGPDQTYRILAERMSEGAATVSADGAIMFCNERLAEMIGLPPAKLVGSPALGLVIPPDRERFQRLLKQGFESESRDEIQLRRHDGSVVPILASLKVIPAAEGLGLCLVATDLTDQKRVEQKARWNEKRYHALAVASSQIIWTTNALGEVTQDVPSWREFTGSSKEEAMGCGWIICLHPDDRERALLSWNRAVETGGPYKTEYRIRRYDGRYRDMVVCGVPVFGDDGEVSEWIGTCSDITESKRAEEALRRSEAALREAQRVARLGSWTMDVKTGHVAWSTELYRMFGIDPALNAVPYYEQERIFAPESWARLTAASDQAAHTGVPYELELETVRMDGSHGWMLAWGDAGRDADGTVTSLHGVALDITERKKAEIERRRLAASVAAMVESTDDMIWSVDDDYRLRTFNSAMQRAIESHHGTLVTVGKTAEELLPPDVAAVWHEMYERAITKGPFRAEYPTSYGRSWELALSPILENGQKTGISVFTRDVTDRKKAEEQLRKSRVELQASEANLSALLESVTDLIWSVDREYRLLTFNGSLKVHFRKNYGTTARVGAVPADLLSAERAAAWPVLYERAFSSGAFVEEYTLPDGRVLELALNPIVQDGKAVGVSVFGKDISERKRSETALMESEDKFRTLSNFVPQMVWMCTPDGLNIYVNQRWVDYTGLTLEESHGRGWNTPFHDDDKQTAWNAWNHAVVTGEPYQMESRLRAADGTYRWFLMQGTPMRDASGNIVKWFGTCTDIEEMKRSEREIRTLNRELDERVQLRTAQLHESEMRVRRKLESVLSPESDLASLELADLLDTPVVQALADDVYRLAQIPIFIVDLKGKPLVSVGWQDVCTKFHRANPEACKNCEESDRELSAGVAPGQFKLYKCKNHLWDAVTPIMLGDTQVGNLFSGQFFFADEVVDCEVFRSQARRYGFNEKEYLAALDRVPRLSREQVETSMTFYVKLAELLSKLSHSGIKLARSMGELNYANSALADSVKELEAFNYAVAHDLRAPLRHIHGFAELLAEEAAPVLNESSKHHLDTIQHSVNHMSQLLEDLLSLSRLGRQELRKRPCGLNALVREVVQSLKPEIKDREVEWRIEELPAIECDPMLMKQILFNLLANALKFSRLRKPAIIEVGETIVGGEHVVFIRDNGVGFDMKYIEKLFGLFQRLHRQQDFEGTGVGLAIVQRLVHRHGGRVWAEAELDKGATFYLSFKICSTEKEEIFGNGVAV